MERLHHLSRRAKLLLAALLILCAGPAAAAGLTDLLMSRVGVSQPQAEGGAGSIFKLAQAQMTPTNFAKLKGAVPGMDQYLGAAPPLAPAAAPATGGTSALAGAAAQALGGSQLGGMSGKLATLQQLAPAFEQLGMKSKLAGKFVPVVVDYVKQQGGLSTAKLLTGALGF